MKMYDKDFDGLDTEPNHDIGDIVEWHGFTVRTRDLFEQKLLIIGLEENGIDQLPSYKCLDLSSGDYIYYTCWYINKNFRKIA